MRAHLCGPHARLVAENRPINAWAEILAKHGFAFLTRSPLYRWTVLRWHRPAPVDPVPDVLLLDSDGRGEAGLRAEQFDRPLECLHADDYTTTVCRLQNICGLPKTTSVVRLPGMGLGSRIEEALAGRQQKFLHEWTDKQGCVHGIPGLRQATLSALIKRDSATSEFAIRIADRLGVSIRWLLDGEGAPDRLEWPFPGIDRAKFDALAPEAKLEIQGVVRERIDAMAPRAAHRETIVVKSTIPRKTVTKAEPLAVTGTGVKRVKSRNAAKKQTTSRRGGA